MDLSSRGRAVLRETFQFELSLKESRLVGGGRGVFVSRGDVPVGHIVGLYPGK